MTRYSQENKELITILVTVCTAKLATIGTAMSESIYEVVSKDQGRLKGITCKLTDDEYYSSGWACRCEVTETYKPSNHQTQVLHKMGYNGNKPMVRKKT